MISHQMISQEEAENLHKLPGPEHVSRLQPTSRSTKITMDNHYRIIEAFVFDPQVHPELGTAEGTKKVKKHITRKHVALVIDVETGLLLPLVPVVENGAAKQDTYRILNHELVKVAYAPMSKERINNALENNNVEVMPNSIRRFFFPSVCLLPKNVDSVRQRRTSSSSSSSSSSEIKSAASALGSSSSRVAAAGSRSRAPTVADALTMVGRLQDERCAEVLLACQTILQACQDDRPDLVPGVFMGVIPAAGAEHCVLPADYIVAAMDKTNQKPTLHQQQLDLMNHVAVGSQLSFVGKYTVSADEAPVTPAKNADPAKIPDSSAAPADSTPCDSPSSPPAATMPTGKSPAVVSTPKSNGVSGKRKTDDKNTDEMVLASGKRGPAIAPSMANMICSADSRARTVDDLTKAIHDAMPVLVDGILSPKIHAAVLPDGTDMQRSWTMGDGNDQKELAPGIVAGMQLSDVFHHSDASRHARVLNALKQVRDSGVEGMSPDDRKNYSTVTVAKMMSDRVIVGKKTSYTNSVMGVLGMQFLAGALHGWLYEDLEKQLKTAVDTVVMPIVAEGDAARVAAADAEKRATEAEKRATEAEERAAKAEASATDKSDLVAALADKTKLESTVEELQKQLKEQVQELEELRQKLEAAAAEDKASSGLEAESNW